LVLSRSFASAWNCSVKSAKIAYARFGRPLPSRLSGTAVTRSQRSSPVFACGLPTITS
jgi:hypothetical protein